MLDTIMLLASATAETGHESGLTAMAHQFGIDWKLILAQVINFGFVSFLLWRFAFKPVMATLEDRQRKIAEGLQYAEESKIQLAETEKRQAEVLREANTKAQEILHETRDKARQFEDKMKAETATQIEEIRKRAEAANELERQKMLQEVRQEIARLVVLTSGKVLQRELGDEEKSRLDKAAAQEISRSN
ncbi:MAG TPA: F0F1 ATP synthase subunit B [Oceanipulchritudo sp.]|nr:F0F1 ATP synthase subunit B [Oceanipulchritudo sp.]